MAIRKNSQPDFKQRYREIDVLLVDDIQFIEGKEQLQEEFFHTFNTLYEAQRQIVFSSDRSPDAIATLEDRLRSRFKSGLITDIQPPDFETRLAILQKKGEQSGSRVPGDVLEFIATNITYNIRELEGALIRVNAYAALNDAQLTVELAQQILADTISSDEAAPDHPRVHPRTDGRDVRLDVEAAVQPQSRTRELVHARQVGMYVCREFTDLSYPQIGKHFGGRDHTTVIHAYEKVSALMKERRKTYEDVSSLIQQILRPLITRVRGRPACAPPRAPNVADASWMRGGSRRAGSGIAPCRERSRAGAPRAPRGRSCTDMDVIPRCHGDEGFSRVDGPAAPVTGLR